MAAVLYGNFHIELLDQHGARLDRLSLETPVPPLRFRDLAPPPPPGTELLGRADLLAELSRDARPGWAVELRAPCGFGKSSLLAAVAAGLAFSRLAPVATVRVGSIAPEDVLDQLFAKLYTASPPVKPTPEQRGGLLAQTRAIVVLDDVGLAAEQVAGILAALPQCLVLVGGEQAVIGAGGVSLALEGLDEQAGVELLARDLGRPLEGDDQQRAARLCAAVHGQPLRLRQAAALAAAGQLSLLGLATRAEHDPRILDRLTAQALGEAERRVLGVLALVAGAVLPGELVEVLSGVGDVAEQLGKLRRRGLVEQELDRFGLPRCLGEDYRKLLQANLRVGASVQPLVTWLRQRDPGSADAMAAASAAVELLGVLAERAEWHELARLAEATSRVLILAGRWESCRRVLEQGLEAARQTGDLLAQARFSHDLGSMQLCLDNLRHADGLLRRALELREQQSDHEGAAITRHNLSLLAPPTLPPGSSQPRQSLAQRVRHARPRLPALLSLAGLLALVIALVVRAVALPTTSTATTVADVTVTVTSGSGGTGSTSGSTGGTAGPGIAFSPSSIVFPDTAVGTATTRTLDVTSTGRAPLRLDDVELEGARADFTADDHCRHVLLPPGRTCRITVQFTPTAEGSRTATLIIHQNLRGPASRVQLAGVGVRGAGQPFSLTVEVQPGTDLRVISVPRGIDCPSVCVASFPAGSRVTLRASTASGTLVWEGDCAGAATTCTLTIDHDRRALVRVQPPPDLVPGNPRRVDNDLVVTVTNQGRGAAPPSTTALLVGAAGPVSADTPALQPGASVDVRAPIPSGCFDPDCDFTVTVDADDQVPESDEGNNSLSGRFIG